MALSIQQAQEYIGNDRWRWSVWLDGSPQDLDAVKHVIYVLHPTFHNPVREIDDRSTNFRLETSSWGTFTIHAKAVFREGREVMLDHDLVLVYPDGTPTAA